MLQCPRSPGFGAAVKPLSSLVPSPQLGGEDPPAVPVEREVDDAVRAGDRVAGDLLVAAGEVLALGDVPDPDVRARVLVALEVRVPHHPGAGVAVELGHPEQGGAAPALEGDAHRAAAPAACSPPSLTLLGVPALLSATEAAAVAVQTIC